MLSFMKNKYSNSILWLLLLVVPLFFSCGPAETADTTAETEETQEETKPVEVIIEAENHTATSGEVEVKPIEGGGNYVHIAEPGWIALDVNIPVAGRYKSSVKLSSPSAGAVDCWMEDYIDNKDDRTYNITGTMTLPEATSSFAEVSRDGSPLNAGIHKMRVHVGQEANIDRVTFTLIREHEVTPELLTQKMDGKEWTVAWSDEFDGTEVDTSKWTYDVGNWGWGNNELQYYTVARTENARIEDGNLIIEARKGDMGEKWTSARLTTRGKVSFLYGKIEIKAKVPVERGNWAAGWTLGDEYVDELSWPYCGEIDIMESVGFEIDDETGDGEAHASVHCGAYYFKLGNQPTATTPVKNMKEEYHLYTVEWTPDGIKAFVDDKQYFNYEDTSTELAWPFGKAQNLILNLAMGGGWGGAKGMDETVTTQKMIIDYVRVYERS
jgi:beta-glucanase (GH16 family)